MRKPWLTLNLLYTLFFKLLFLSCLMATLACHKQSPKALEIKNQLFDSVSTATLRPIPADSLPLFHSIATSRIKKNPLKIQTSRNRVDAIIMDTIPLKYARSKNISWEKDSAESKIKKITITLEKKTILQSLPKKVLPFSRRSTTLDVQYLNPTHNFRADEIEAIYQDKKGNLWLGGEHGLIEYNGNTYVQYIEHTIADNFEETFKEMAWPIAKIIANKAENLWLLSNHDAPFIQYYDGTYLTTFQSNYFSEDWWEDMIVDSRGNCWISSEDYGLIKMNGQEFSYNLAPLIGEDAIITALYEDDKGHIWIGTSSGILAKYDGTLFWDYSPEGNFESAEITAIYQYEDKLWLATSTQDIYTFDSKNFHLYTKINHSCTITHFQEDIAGKLWLTSADGCLFQFDGATFTYYSDRIDSRGIEGTNFLFDNQGLIWLGIQNTLAKIDANSFKKKVNIEEFSIGNQVPEINTISEDLEGNLLLGTDMGLIKLEEEAYYRITSEDTNAGITLNEESNIEYVFVANDNTIWLSLSSIDHINLVKIEGQKITFYQDAIIGLGPYFFQDSKQRLWVIDFPFGVYCIDKSSQPSLLAYHPQNLDSLNQIVEEQDQNDEGDYTNDAALDMLKTLYLEKITQIVEDKSGDLWFSFSNSQIARFDGKKLYWFIDDQSLDLLGMAIPDHQSTLIAKNGAIWITADKGLARFDGFQFHFLTEHDGLPPNHDLTRNLFEDNKGRFWVSSTHELSLLIPQKKDGQEENYQIRNYGIADGLWQKDASTSFLDSKNTYWYQEENGALAYLDLNNFKTNDHQPTIQLNQIFVQNELIQFQQLSDSTYIADNTLRTKLAKWVRDSIPSWQNYPEKLVVPYTLNELTFHFSAIDWAAPHKLKYSYFVEGIDRAWSDYNSKNTLDLNRLPYGTYTLKAKAIGESQIESEEVTYSFSIAPPWWWSNWAYTGYLILFLGALWWAYVLVKRRLKLQNRLAIEQQEAFRLKELDSFKSRLFTNLTHEFRTPLTVILGMSKQIIAAPKENVLEAAQLIKRNGRNLLLLVNQLLELSKLENKAYQLNIQQADILFYIRYLVESFHSYTNEHNLSLRFFSPLEQLMMDFDPHSIQQVITNLLSNAVKFTPSGGDILVQLTKEKDWLIIAVKDTGIGITPANLPHIFDRFYQADSSTTRPGEGTGIGLAHTQELVKIMGGTITVTSELGIGSHFQIRLPIHNKATITQTEMVSTDLALPVTALKPIANEAPISFVQSPSISASELPQLLLIEDNPDVIFYLKSCLKDLYQIKVAYNGKIGIEKALEHIPDVIISDVMMPEKDGYQVCQALKNEERTSHIPIIILTAKVDIASRIKGLKTGADAYLSKPFNKEELLVRLEMMLELRRKLQAHFAKIATNPIAFHKNIADQLAQPSRYATENAFLQKVMANIEKELSNALFNPTRLSRAVGLSQSQLYRKIKALTNTTPALLIRKIRLDKGMILLKTTDLTVSEIAYEVGFTDPAYFSRTFSETFGSPPNANRN